eukprot:2522926-Rhodomonas_salina.1
MSLSWVKYSLLLEYFAIFWSGGTHMLLGGVLTATGAPDGCHPRMTPSARAQVALENPSPRVRSKPTGLRQWRSKGFGWLALFVVALLAVAFSFFILLYPLSLVSLGANPADGVLLQPRTHQEVHMEA